MVSFLVEAAQLKPRARFFLQGTPRSIHNQNDVAAFGRCPNGLCSRHEVFLFLFPSTSYLLADCMADTAADKTVPDFVVLAVIDNTQEELPQLGLHG
jgi:hypothetical protein